MKRPLAGFHILLTAGPTREPLDPVRYLSNRSSGEMGLAIAEAVRRMGARVTVVLGPVSLPAPAGVAVVRVETARQMSSAVRARLNRSDAFIATAAVADWRFASPQRRKLKKGSATALTVHLRRNPDILADAGRAKGRGKRPLLVGFALETDRLEARARRKLVEKNADLIIGNSPASFGSRLIRPLWVERAGRPDRLPLMTKKALSSRLGRWLGRRLASPS